MPGQNHRNDLESPPTRYVLPSPSPLPSELMDITSYLPYAPIPFDFSLIFIKIYHKIIALRLCIIIRTA